MIEETLEDFDIDMDDIIKLSTPKLPICLCLDISSSMGGEPIKALNEGVETFISTLSEIDIAKYAVEIAVVSFNCDVEVVLDFDAVENQFVPEFTASGLTSMGQAVNKCLDMLEERKRHYKQSGETFKQPWLALLTDGYSTDETTDAVTRCKQFISEKKLVILPMGIGDNYDQELLKNFSNKNFSINIKDSNSIKEAFSFLSQSAESASQSAPGSSLDLTEAIEDKKGISIVL